MEDNIEKLAESLRAEFAKKVDTYKKEVLDSPSFVSQQNYLARFTSDFILALRSVSIYSTRAKDMYDNFLTIRAIDDLLQSVVQIQFMIENGIHNPVRRELRYLIEMMTKYLTVDYEKMGESITVKTQYLADNIPRSSIDVIDRCSLPFTATKNEELRGEVTDLFKKACAYVHPSKKQVDEQLKNYDKGAYIGFETVKMIVDLNKVTFRVYDILLVMLFHGFGPSMTKDLFESSFNDQKGWKFHKGKYTKELAATFK